jgi:class 3 adenylate cyclase
MGHTTLELEYFVNNTSNVIEQVAWRNQLAYQLRNDNALRAISLGQESYEQSVQLGHPLSVVTSLYVLGVAHTCLPHYENALQYLFDALENSRSSALPQLEMKILRWIGIVYNRSDIHVLALEYFHQSHIIAERLEDFAYAAQALRNIGAVYMTTYKDYERALNYLTQAWEYQEMSGETDKLELGVTLRNLGELYVKLKEYKIAEEKFTVCLQYFLSVQDFTGYNMTKLNLGRIAEEQGNLPKALTMYKRILRDAYTHDYWIGKVWVNISIGKLFLQAKKPTHALPYLLDGLNVADDLSVTTAQADIHEALSEVYHSLQQYQQAFYHLQSHTNLRKQSMSEELKQVRSNLQKGFELERAHQDAEIYRLKNVELAEINADNEKLLLNVLPSSIARRLKNGETLIAENFHNVSVLFADIVGFTKLSATHSPETVVNVLNRIFSAFDVFSEQYQLEKIKTIGDAYMIVGGLPEPNPANPESVASMALEMIQTIDILSKTLRLPLQVRIGIHIGSVVAGIIGQKKFSYDLWGDTVNTASRMESHGFPGTIHCTEEVYHALCHQFYFEPRGVIDVKGKGFMRTYFLKGKHPVSKPL